MNTPMRLAILKRPESIDEARQRLIDVDVEIGSLTTSLAAGFRLNHDGTRMEPGEYVAWRKRTSTRLTWFRREKRIVEEYIAQYERDVKAEERAANHEEHQRLMKALSQEWRAEKQDRHRQARLDLANFMSEVDIDPGSPISLLSHMYQLVRRLAREHRVEYTPSEQALIDVVRDAAMAGLFRRGEPTNTPEVDVAELAPMPTGYTMTQVCSQCEAYSLHYFDANKGWVCEACQKVRDAEES